MKQYNYPTKIYFGNGALEKGVEDIAKTYKKPLIVTDKQLVELGFAQRVKDLFGQYQISPIIFDETHSNPIEEDAIKGATLFIENSCDCLIGLGGGSPMDVAKVIAVRVTHDGPLAQYDDAKGGDALIDGAKLPRNFAIPTTAGTGSEVGRAGVITVKETGNKTIIFHPKLLPTLAILEPELTKNLPRHITVATGLDAFTHCLEAYFAPGFHPMADGIAYEGIRLILENLRICVETGHNLDARGKMMMAASMGATAFQKGLGMIHAIAHPLSSECGLHHGLANALMLPYCVEFLESSKLNSNQRWRIKKINQLFEESGVLVKDNLSQTSFEYFKSFNINFGLRNHGVSEGVLSLLAKKAYMDVSHQTNMIPVTEADLLFVIKKAY